MQLMRIEVPGLLWTDKTPRWFGLFHGVVGTAVDFVRDWAKTQPNSEEIRGAQSYLSWQINSNPDNFPPPSQDGLNIVKGEILECFLYKSPTWRFGCKPSQLKVWQQDLDLVLSKLGAAVAEYEVPDELVVEGNNQVVFDMEFATLLRRTPIVAEET